MRQRLEKALWFVVDNGPTLLTIGFAAYVIALAQTSQISTEILLQWILAILGLLAISELVERFRKIRNIEQTNLKILSVVENKFTDRPSADRFFSKRLPALDAYFEKASDIRLSGVALQRTVRENIDVLRNRLKEGASIQIILVDPKGAAAQRIADPTANLSIEHLQANTQITIQNLKWLNQSPETKGNIELKFIDEGLHFNIVAIDSNREYGVIFVEFFPQRWVRGSRPRIELTSKRDEYWFGYFKDQFDKMWQECTPISLEDINQK